MQLLVACALLACALGFSVPPHSSYFATSHYTRGLWLQTPEGFWINGIRAPDEVTGGDQVAQILYISGIPHPFPLESRVVSLFESKGTPGVGFICVEPPLYIPPFGIVGFVAGRRSGDTVTYSYTAASSHGMTVFGAPATIRRLQIQTNFLLEPSLWGSQANEPMGRVVLSYTRDRQSLAGCVAPPPDPDAPKPDPPATTGGTTGGTTGDVPPDAPPDAPVAPGNATSAASVPWSPFGHT